MHLFKLTRQVDAGRRLVPLSYKQLSWKLCFLLGLLNAEVEWLYGYAVPDHSSLGAKISRSLVLKEREVQGACLHPFPFKLKMKTIPC